MSLIGLRIDILFILTNQPVVLRGLICDTYPPPDSPDFLWWFNKQDIHTIDMTRWYGQNLWQTCPGTVGGKQLIVAMVTVTNGGNENDESVVAGNRTVAIYVWWTLQHGVNTQHYTAICFIMEEFFHGFIIQKVFGFHKSLKLQCLFHDLLHRY